MKHKFFAFDPETGFKTYETEKMARMATYIAINRHTIRAGGYSDAIEAVHKTLKSEICWGEIKQTAPDMDVVI